MQPWLHASHSGCGTFVYPWTIRATLEILAMHREMTVDERGAIFTRVEEVDFMLDLVGYGEVKALAKIRFMEPSAGHGEFVIAAIGRKITSHINHGGSLNALTPLLGAMRVLIRHYNELSRIFP